MAGRQRKQRAGSASGRDGGDKASTPTEARSPAARIAFGLGILIIVATFAAYFARSKDADAPGAGVPQVSPRAEELVNRPEPIGADRPSAVLSAAAKLAAEGESLLTAGRVDEAIAVLKKAIAVDAAMDAPLVNLGNAYIRKRDYAAAVSAYESALGIRPASAPAHANLGIALSALGRVPEAIEHFAKAVELDPKSAEAQFNLGNAYADVGRLPDAEAALRAALKLDPQHREAQYKLGVVLQQLDRPADAIILFRDLLRQDADHVGAHYRLALALVAAEQYDEAMRQYEEVIGLRPTDAALAYDIGQAFYDKYQYRPACVAFKYATMVDSGLLMAYLKAGNGFQRINRLTEAEDEFRAGLANVAPATETRVRAALHFNLANVLMRQERGAEAIEQYQRALDLDPTHVSAQYGIGLAFEHEQENDSAIDAFEATLGLDPNHEGAKTHLSLLREGRMPQAGE